MNNQEFKKAFTNSIMNIDPIRDTWELLGDNLSSANPYKAFLSANKDKFTGNIFTFEPVFMPINGYDIEVSNFKITENYIKLRLDCILSAHDDSEMYDSDYFKLVLVHVLTNPLDKSDPPFKIITLTSGPKRFDISKSYKFRLPVPPELNNVYDLYKYHRTFAFFINYNIEKDLDESGNEFFFDAVCSCSIPVILNAMLLEEIDISFPSGFSD